MNTKTKKTSKILASAKETANLSSTWADLSNALFDPEQGLVAKAYPTREAREGFVRSDTYRAIRKLLHDAIEKTGLVDGATPLNKSGKFIVRLPRTLHAALESEADNEGVSLNQLVVTKLAIQMSQLANRSTEMAAIARAYLEVRDGYSIDRVVADPAMNSRFLHLCRDYGLTESGFDLNWTLFNSRKNKYLSDLPKTKTYTVSKKDEIEFSSEIAVRYVQDKVWEREARTVSLDKIICDPELAAEFDYIAAKLAPGFSSLDYRWVALGVRKAAGRYAKEAKAASVPPFDLMGNTHSIKASSIPTEQGLYLFRCEDSSLFVGETDNLRNRIERHFDTGGADGIPEWLFERGSRAITLSIVPMPSVSATNRKIVELGSINKFHPLLNYFGTNVA